MQHDASFGTEADLPSVAGRHTEQEEEQKAQDGPDHTAVRVKRMAGNQTDLAGTALEVLRTATHHS